MVDERLTEFYETLPKGWQCRQFGDVLVDGTRNGIYKAAEHHGMGVRIVNMRELFAFPRLRDVEMKHVQVTSGELSKVSLAPGDLLFARRSLVAEGAGKCSVVLEVPEPTVFESSIIRGRPDRDKADSLFLYYLFGSALGRHLLGSILRQTSVSGITGTDLLELPIPLPPLDEQLAIAEVLGALDDKIELNRQMNHTLEETASALFKSWFVDFDPIVAKIDGRKPFGMDTATAALFPAALEDSELGSLPKGWRATTVASCVADIFDGPHATPPEATSGAVFLGIGNMTGTGLDLSAVRYIAESEWAQWTRRITPGEGDIVFTYEAALGRFALLPAGLRCCLGRRMALVRPRKLADAPFLFHQFVAQPFQEVVAARSWTGSTVDRTPLTEFPDYPFLWPGEALVARFSEQVAPMWALIHHNQSESRTLATLRDTLLPTLLSGEVRLKHAKKAVEAAL